MEPAQAYVKCAIVRWVDDEPQPGIVEARIVDADGRAWTFLEKTAIVDWEGTAGPDSIYPCPGLIRCGVLDYHGGAAGPPAILVTTLRPDGVESVQRRSGFRVTVDQLAWSIGNDGGQLSGRLEPETLVGARLLGAIAAWHVHDGTRSPTPVDVWLVLDPAGPVRVGVAADWRLSVERQGVYEPYDMQEYGRIEVDVPGADFALCSHVGNRILAAEAACDATTGQLIGMTLSFETGSVRVHSHGGDLLLGAAAP
jgi:hypothetical protein